MSLLPEQILKELGINDKNPGAWAGSALENTIENLSDRWSQ